MPSETVFRGAFWVLIGLVLIMRAYFVFRLRRSGGRIMPDQAAIEHEGKFVFAFRLLGFFVLVGLLALYALRPDLIETLSYQIPDWLRWAGFALALVSLALWTWVQLVLGNFWSTQLRMRDSHRLITTGPYTIARHPMYVAICGFAFGLALETANWCFAILALLVIVGLIVRIPREDQMMIEAFGEEYRAYMKKTGSFFPR